MKKAILVFILIFTSQFSFSKSGVLDTIYLKDSKLYWKYSGSSKVDTFFIQQLRWNKWVKVGTIKADSSRTIYDCNVVPHFGENQFRLNCKMKNGKFVFSQTIKYSDPKDSNYIRPFNKLDSVYFQKIVNWEIYDKFGNILTKGEGDRLSIKELTPDVYYLMYKNKVVEFIRPKSFKRNVFYYVDQH